MFSRSFSARSFSAASWRFLKQPAVTPAQVYGGGGGTAGREYSDDDIRALIDAKYEALERQARPVLAPATEPERESEAVAAVALAAAAAGPAARGNVQVPAPPARVDSAGPAFAPTAADRARQARLRDDEEALMLMLLGEV